MSLTVTLPFPPAELNPNRKNGKHWSSTHAVKTRYLADCRLLTVQAMRGAMWVPRAGKLALSLTFVQPDKRARDIDNMLAASKAALDGVAMALGIDDHHFEPLTLRRAYGSKPGGLVVEIDCA